MRLLALIVMSLIWGLALPATVYKWVDENGVTHYSDQPHPGAKKIELQSVQTYTAPPPPAVQPAVGATAVAEDAQPYKVCEIFRPTPDEVLLNVSSVTVKLRLDPELRASDTVLIALDGKRVTGLPPSGEEFVVTPVFRGTHSVMAIVQDARGRNVCQTSAITFHARQASQLAPRSPTKQATPPPRAPRPPTRP